MESKTAIGSLLPDSNSRIGLSPVLRCMPLVRMMAKTAGASGGRNNNAQEQRNFKGEADKIIGADKQEKGGQKHAGRGQYGTAHDNGFDFVPFGFQSAGKKNKSQGDGADVVAEAGVGKLDFTDAVGTGQHADAQKQQ